MLPKKGFIEPADEARLRDLLSRAMTVQRELVCEFDALLEGRRAEPDPKVLERAAVIAAECRIVGIEFRMGAGSIEEREGEDRG